GCRLGTCDEVVDPPVERPCLASAGFLVVALGHPPPHIPAICRTLALKSLARSSGLLPAASLAPPAAFRPAARRRLGVRNGFGTFVPPSVNSRGVCPRAARPRLTMVGDEPKKVFCHHAPVAGTRQLR